LRERSIIIKFYYVDSNIILSVGLFVKSIDNAYIQYILALQNPSLTVV